MKKFLPSHSTAFHFVCQLNIFTVNVELPLPLAKYASKHSTRVNSYPHVYRTISFLLDIFNCIHHGQSHMDAKDGMIGSLDWCSTYAVVTVTQNFDAQLFIPVKEKRMMRGLKPFIEKLEMKQEFSQYLSHRLKLFILLLKVVFTYHKMFLLIFVYNWLILSNLNKVKSFFETLYI